MKNFKPTANYAKRNEAEHFCGFINVACPRLLGLHLKMWQLVLSLLQHLSATPAIVVERNMFAYYKLPFKSLETEAQYADKSPSRLYYVLQCPPKLDDSIPKPRDMPICSVVDQYKDIWRSRKSKQKSNNNPRRRIPGHMMLRPLPPATVQRMQWGWRQRRTKRHDQHKTALQDLHSPLQHLGQPHHKQKLLKLSADHQKFKRGNRTKGYQHMYHRDESYNDHIFYDELKLDGEFVNRGKENTKQ